jgi:hypothetical protein
MRAVVEGIGRRLGALEAAILDAIENLDDLTSVPVRVGEPGDVSVGSGGGSAIRRHPAAVILGRMYASWLRWPR